MSYRPDPDDLVFDEASGAYYDTQSGNLYRDADGEDAITEGYSD